MLIKAGADPDFPAADTLRTPYHWAFFFDDCEEIVKALVEVKADANARARGGDTPFMWALHLARLESIQLMYEQGGADITVVDNDGYDAVSEAGANANYDGLGDEDRVLRWVMQTLAARAQTRA
jgi:ankyrin repeat protein